MGQYLIPGATSTKEAAVHVGLRQGCEWHPVEGGVLFVDPSLTDEECAALYADFTPSGTDDLTYRAPLPDRIRNHVQHLKAFRDAVRSGDTSSITQDQRDHVLADVIDGLYFVNRRIETG